MNMRRKLLVLIGVTVVCLAGGLAVLFWLKHPEVEREQLWLQSRLAGATPIAFYGKVVDENGSSVANADIRFSTTDLSPRGNSEYFTTSDQNGFFSLLGVNGKHLSVYVTKGGYYESPSDRISFMYGGTETPFAPDPKNPVIFHLRKHGETVALIKKGRNFKLPLDGTSVELDLAQCAEVPEGKGHIIIQCWISDPSAKYNFDWRWRITVPNGGLQEIAGEFPFQAPTKGYQTSDEQEIKQGDPNWRRSADRRYFLKLSDGNYALARISLKPKAVSPFFNIEYFLNPTGSPNLEHDPRQRGHWGNP